MSTTLLASIGIDIGKEVFHVVGFGTDGKIAFRRKIKRLALVETFKRLPLNIVCQSARKFGSDAVLVQLLSFCADQSGLEKIDFPAAIHLAPDELEARDLAFGLAVRPGQSDRCSDRRFVFGDAVGERGDETSAGAVDPRDEARLSLASDHQVEFGDDLACLDQGWYASFDRRDRDGLRFREQISADGHQACDGSGRRNPLKISRVGLFSSSSADRPLADDAERASEATRL
jgi:hypothetical protein